MKISFYTIVAAISFFMFSCSNSNEPKSLEVIKEVEGPLNSNLEVISDNATIEIVEGDFGFQIEFSVELKVSEPANMKGGYSGNSPFGPTIEYRLLDANKVPIKVDGYRIRSNPDLDKISYNLGNADAKFWIQIFQKFADEYEKDKVKKMQKTLNKAKYVQLTSRIQG